MVRRQRPCGIIYDVGIRVQRSDSQFQRIGKCGFRSFMDDAKALLTPIVNQGPRAKPENIISGGPSPLQGVVVEIKKP